MDNSRNFIPSSSPLIFGDNGEEPIPQTLPHQHALVNSNSSNAFMPTTLPHQPIFPSPYSSNPPPMRGTLPQQNALTNSNTSNAPFYDQFIPRYFMQRPNFTIPQPTPMIYEGPRYWMNPDGYIASNTTGESAERTQTFKEKLVIFEIPNGFEVISSVTQFAQRYDLTVSVVSGTGMISEIDFRYPTSANPPVHFSGCYQIISFSGTHKRSSGALGNSVICFTASLIDAHGNYMGGLIASTMIAVNNVRLVVCATN